MLTEYKGKALTPIAGNEPLKAGDHILIRFAWVIAGDWYRSYEWGQVEKALEGRPDWRVISYRNDANFLDAEIEILQVPARPASYSPDPGSGITQVSLIAIPAAVAIVAASIAVVVVTVRYVLKDAQEYYRFKSALPLVESGQLPPSVLNPAPDTSPLATASNGLHVLAWAALAGVLTWAAMKIIRR